MLRTEPRARDWHTDSPMQPMLSRMHLSKEYLVAPHFTYYNCPRAGVLLWGREPSIQCLPHLAVLLSFKIICCMYMLLQSVRGVPSKGSQSKTTVHSITVGNGRRERLCSLGNEPEDAGFLLSLSRFFSGF